VGGRIARKGKRKTEGINRRNAARGMVLYLGEKNETNEKRDPKRKSVGKWEGGAVKKGGIRYPVARKSPDM